MIKLTPQAQSLRDEYFRQVRAYVSASGSADADDVLRDVEDHLQRELQSADQPVPADEVRRVLDRLGSPSQWVAPDGLSWWRKIILRARCGPDDWRLAYVTMGLLLVGVLFGWFFSDTSGGLYYETREFNPVPLAIFAALSFLTARAAMASSATAGGLSDGQKWLVYPVLIWAALSLGTFILGWAPAAAGGGAYAVAEHAYKHQVDAMHRAGAVLPAFMGKVDLRAGIAAGLAAVAAAGLWWAVLSLLLRGRLGRAAQTVFRPFLDNCLPKVRKAGLVIGIILFVLGCGLGAAYLILFAEPQAPSVIR